MIRFPFRMSIKVAPGVRLNLGKGGLTSVRLGPRGAGVTIGKRGVRASANLPGPFSASTKIADLPSFEQAGESRAATIGYTIFGFLLCFGVPAAVVYWLLF